MKKNKEVVLAAVTQNGHVLQLASEDMKDDKEVVLAAVTQLGGALQHASKDMKKNKEVVLAAVSVSDELSDLEPFTLEKEYRGKEIKNDQEFDLGEVRQNGKALQYASEEMKKDK